MYSFLTLNADMYMCISTINSVIVYHNTKTGLWSNVSPFAQKFLPPIPFAQNAVRPGSVRPPVLFLQVPFAHIFMLWPTLGNVWYFKPLNMFQSWRKLFSNNKLKPKLILGINGALTKISSNFLDNTHINWFFFLI